MSSVYASGFGDASTNGRYDDDGTYDGQPRWVNSSGTRWIRSSAGGSPRWYIATTQTGAGTGAIYYDNNLIAADPFPYSGGVSWVDAGGGAPLGSVVLLVDYSMSAAVGAFTLTGIDAALLRGYTLACEAGAFVLTGVAAGLRVLGWVNRSRPTSTWTDVTRSDQ